MKDDKRRTRAPVNRYVAGQLRRLRQERGMTVQEMSRLSGIAPGSYSCLEHGWYRFHLDNLFKVLHVLGLTPNDVWPSPDGLPEGRIEAIDLAAAVKPSRNGGGPGVEDVLEAVCGAFGLSRDKLRGTQRWSRLVEARAACGILAGEQPGMTLRSVAAALGTHAASLSRLAKRHQQQAEEDPDFAGRLEAARLVLAGGE